MRVQELFDPVRKGAALNALVRPNRVDAVEKGLRTSPNSDFRDFRITEEAAMMGRRGEQWSSVLSISAR